MPVMIACPKCQTRYQLPDSSLGKAIKCQKCGTAFKTKAPAQQRPAQQQKSAGQKVSAQQQAQEMAKLGIDGPLRRQGDIFAGALPQGAGQLGNYAAEDPGFGDHAEFQSQSQPVEEKKPNAGMESILGNPYAATSSGRAKKRRPVKRDTVDSGPYSVARIGMRILFCSIAVMLGSGAGYSLFTLLARVAPDLVRSVAKIGDGTGAVVLGVAVLVLIGLYFLSLLTAFLGQIVCIYSPNSNEKVFAGLGVGCIAGVLVACVVLFLIGRSTLLANPKGVDIEGAAVIGVSALIGGCIIYALILGNLCFLVFYFRSVGKNVRSKKIMEGAKVAGLMCIFAVVISVVSMIVMFVMALVFKGQPEKINIARDISIGINMLLIFSTLSGVMTMVKTTLDVLKTKS